MRNKTATGKIRARGLMKIIGNEKSYNRRNKFRRFFRKDFKMKKNVFFAMFAYTLLLTVMCSEEGSEPLSQEDPQTSLRIKNATGKNFRELLPPTVVSEPVYDNVQDFYYTVNVGHFGFRLDTLANDSLSYSLNSFTETTATQLFTRCRFTCRVHLSSSSYNTVTKDVKDTINLPEQITCKLGKKYTIVLNDLNGDVDFIESEK